MIATTRDGLYHHFVVVKQNRLLNFLYNTSTSVKALIRQIKVELFRNRPIVLSFGMMLCFLQTQGRRTLPLGELLFDQLDHNIYITNNITNFPKHGWLLHIF